IGALRREQVDEDGAGDQEPQAQAHEPARHSAPGPSPVGGPGPDGGRRARRRIAHAGWRRSLTTRAGAPTMALGPTVTPSRTIEPAPSQPPAPTTIPWDGRACCTTGRSGRSKSWP